MKRLVIALAFWMAALCPSHAQRLVETACEDWVFQYVPQPKKLPKGIPPQAQSKLDDSSWKQVCLPHTWQTYETTGELHPYIASPHAKDNEYWWTGTGFYRKHFTLGSPIGNDRLFVEFDGVMKYCRAWLNDFLIGEHFGGYGCFTFELTPYLKEGENVFVLEVGNNQNDPHLIPPMDAGCWNFYGGIYREARFVRTKSLFIPFQGSHEYQGGTQVTTNNLSDRLSRVRIRTWVKNDSNLDRDVLLETHITDKNGKEVLVLSESRLIYHGETTMFDQNGLVNDPYLWSPDSPDQYTAVSKVILNGCVMDTYSTKFGIRTFEWDHDSRTLLVNGKAVNIHGFNRHQEYPWLGDAIPYFIHRMDLLDMKYNLGCNALRPGQYCSGPEVFELADSLGLITFAELPNVKNRNFSREMQRIQAVEMVRRLRNCPSVLLFDLGDETDRAADSRWIHDESPDHYITCRHGEGTGGAFISITDKELRMSKMLRCAVRGWYSREDKDFEPENQQWAGTDGYRHEIALRGKKEGQNDDRIDQPNLMVWLYEDHGCDREYRNAPLLHYNPKGWVDSYRVPKYAYYLWQANYTSSPMVFAMPHYWRSQYVGTRQDIVVDSNCEQVMLLAAGRNMGTLAPGRENLHSVTFRNVPISKGELVVIGLNAGKEAARCTVPMTGAAKSLSISSFHESIPASRGSVTIVTADILDKAGHHINGARNTLKWSVSGPATLVGAEEYVSQFDDQAARFGTLYIDAPASNVIRSTGEAGEIVVTVSSDGLESASVKINAYPKTEAKCITE